MSISLNTVRIARRGRGAKGSVEAQVIGFPVLDDNGIVKKLKYDDIAIPASELMEFAQAKGLSITKVLCEGLDALLKRAALNSGNAKTLLRMRIIKLGLAKNEKEASPIASAAGNFAKVTGESLAEVLEAMCKRKNLVFTPDESDLNLDSPDEETDETE